MPGRFVIQANGRTRHSPLRMGRKGLGYRRHGLRSDGGIVVEQPENVDAFAPRGDLQAAIVAAGKAEIAARLKQGQRLGRRP